MKKTCLVALLVLLSGCGLYNVSGHFAASNQSEHTIQWVVASKNAGPQMGPNATTRFDASVPVSSGSGGTTDPTQKQTSVQVQVYDLTEGRLIQQTAYCTAGENVLTYLTYLVYQGGYEQIECNTSYDRIPAHRDTLTAP